MIRTGLLLCLLAARASGRPGLAWRLEVGCDINGFFVELLGLLGALDAVVPGGVVVRGLRCDERELAKLFPEEAAVLIRATSRDDDDESVPEVLHGRCGEGATHERLPVYVYGQARPRAARLMVERTHGAGDAEVYSCAARAAVVVAPTKWNAEQFGDRAVVAPEAVDPSLFSRAAAGSDDDARSSIEALLGPKRKAFRVLSIFKWERRKAPDVLVDGFFSAFDDADAELVIHAYRPSWERGDKDLRRVAERMRPAGNKARITWLGGVELSRRELRALYAAVDCFALPTRGEGWGLPVHEALAMALPTVVTGVAGPLDITGGNGTAWLLDPGGRGGDGLARPRPEDLAAALREVRDDPAGALKRAAAGRERVASLFHPRVVARTFVEALGEGFFLHDEL